MTYVIEFEGFQCEKFFAIKELAIVSEECAYVKHFVIQPPKRRRNLNTNEKKIVKFCETFLHRIHWNSGDSSWKSVCNYIQGLPQNTCVYTKGVEKQKILSDLFSNLNVINLEDIKCPPITKLIYTPSIPCPLAFHRNVLNCAHRKAGGFADFIFKHEQSCAK